jgi:glutaredoxin
MTPISDTVLHCHCQVNEESGIRRGIPPEAIMIIKNGNFPLPQIHPNRSRRSKTASFATLKQTEMMKGTRVMSDSDAKDDKNTSTPEVKMYSLSTCSHCKATKKFLGECTIKYDFIDVDLLEGEERKAIIEDVKKFNPRCSFPTIIIGEKVIVGFKEKEIKEALGM